MSDARSWGDTSLFVTLGGKDVCRCRRHGRKPLFLLVLRFVVGTLVQVQVQVAARKFPRQHLLRLRTVRAYCRMLFLQQPGSLELGVHAVRKECV